MCLFVCDEVYYMLGTACVEWVVLGFIQTAILTVGVGSSQSVDGVTAPAAVSQWGSGWVAFMAVTRTEKSTYTGDWRFERRTRTSTQRSARDPSRCSSDKIDACSNSVLVVWRTSAPCEALSF